MTATGAGPAPQLDPSASPSPVFVVGSERSGSTLFRLMLAHHPDIAMVGQFEYAVSHIDDPDGWPDLAAYRAALDLDRVFTSSGLSVDPALSYPELVRDFLDQCRTRTGKPIAAAVVHDHFDRLLRIWPEARFVHLVRDGRDVARSCVGMGWAGDVWHGAQRWLDAETLWDRLAEAVPDDRRCEVRYDELVTDTEATLARVCDFVGVPYSSAMLAYADASDYTPPDPDKVEQWRSALTPREIQLVESRIGDLLVARGYEPSGLARVEPTPAELRVLRIRNSVAKLRFRARLYGPGITAADLLARRLRLRRLAVRVRRRINDIDRARLKKTG